MGKLTSRSADISSAYHSSQAVVVVPTVPHRAHRILLALVLSSSALAKPEGNVSAPPPASSSQQESKTADKAPSRLVDTADLAPYLESISAQFLIRGRVRDPFGKIQDPTVKPVVKAPTTSGIRRTAPVQTTPFADIVRKISITTVMPGEKRFLIGTRSFKQGEQMPLNFRGKTIRAQVTEVTSQQISFRNLESGENATRRLDLLPAGMTSGNHEITAPGMVPDRPNAPIELEAGE
jgi:hypothetical protein